MLSEIRLATVGVASLEAAIAFYREALGYRLLECGAVPPATASFWRASTSAPLTYAILAADESGQGRLRLLAGNPPGEPVWAGIEGLSGTGYYALNFRCRDLDGQLRRIAAAGGRAGRAVRWTVSERVTVLDSMNADPDGTHLDLFCYERGGELRGPLLTEVSVLQTVAIASADVDRSRRFWEALGFRELFDRVLDFPELAALLGSPRPLRLRNANLIKDGTIVPGRIEMFAVLDGPPPRPLAARARPPARGILMVSLLCGDLAAAARAIAEAGGRVLGEFSGERPGFGRGRALLAEGPDGEAIELVAR
ncbi:MAG: hypothetical protein RML12_10810 [Xanthomonadales bacterium]|nr:hypothetical protein [Xanthomonadales bacterium]